MSTFEQTFKNIDDILYKDSGADSEIDYIEQTSWVLFLRYLDQLEQDKADADELQGKTNNYILSEEYRWNSWAYTKDVQGNLNHKIALIALALVQFTHQELFHYLECL